MNQIRSYKSIWTKPRKAMNSMLLEQVLWDKKCVTLRSKTSPNLCEWCNSADEPAPEITEQSFSERITINSISIILGGSFSVYFDDDMFFGHCIIARGSLKKVIISADRGEIICPLP